MTQKSSIHFDISERKVLLRIMDIVSVLGLLYVVGKLFHFDYFEFTEDNWYWSVVLAVYLTLL
jgi:hypothetical protein